MRILIINRFFGGEQTPTGRMGRDVAAELHRQAHEVSVLVSRSDYTGAAAEKSDDGRVFNVKAVKEPGRGRLLGWGGFWIHSLFAMASRRWDCCLLLTDPPFLPLAAWLTRPFRTSQQRIYWWTMDIYPEALVAAGMIREDGAFNRVLRRLNEAGLRVITGVIALGPRQLQRLQTYRHWRAEPTFATVVPPWDFRSLPHVESSVARIGDQLGTQGRKVALYTGNLGEGHLFAPLAEGARCFWQQGRKDWLFIFAIRGSGRRELEKMTADLPNFKVCDYFPVSDTAGLLWSATVHLVTMKPGWEGVIVPSKLYGALNTRAPVLFLGPLSADTAGELKAFNRGQSLPPEATGQMVASALDELANPSWAHETQLVLDGPRRIAEFITAEPVRR
jgi:hypothetical protein